MRIGGVLVDPDDGVMIIFKAPFANTLVGVVADVTLGDGPASAQRITYKSEDLVNNAANVGACPAVAFKLFRAEDGFEDLDELAAGDNLNPLAPHLFNRSGIDPGDVGVVGGVIHGDPGASGEDLLERGIEGLPGSVDYF